MAQGRDKRPNKRQRSINAAIARQSVNANPNTLIAQYEREIKSTALSSEVARLTNEIARLKVLIEQGGKKEKLKAKTILTDRPKIESSLSKKKGKMRSWVSVYQGGSTGLKK